MLELFQIMPRWLRVVTVILLGAGALACMGVLDRLDQFVALVIGILTLMSVGVALHDDP